MFSSLNSRCRRRLAHGRGARSAATDPRGGRRRPLRKNDCEAPYRFPALRKREKSLLAVLAGAVPGEDHELRWLLARGGSRGRRLVRLSAGGGRRAVPDDAHLLLRLLLVGGLGAGFLSFRGAGTASHHDGESHSRRYAHEPLSGGCHRITSSSSCRSVADQLRCVIQTLTTHA